MSKFNSLSVKSDSNNRNQFDLSLNHLTTLEFGQVVPLVNYDCIAGDQFSLKYNIFSRCAPLVLPTYGKIELKTASYFVPYYQVMEEFDSFLIGKSSYKGRACALRQFSVHTFMQLMINNSLEVTDSGTYDFIVYPQRIGVNFNKYRLTSRGKYLYKVFRSLGYQIPSHYSLDDENPRMLNALPFLCYCKAVNDYFSQSVLYDNSVVSATLRRICDGSVITIGYLDLVHLTDVFHLLYQPDYFSTAWASPNAPLPGIVSPSVSDATTQYGNVFTNNRDDAYLSTYVENSNAIIAQTDLDVLKSFSNWMRRNAYSGSRTLETVYSRYGIKVGDFSVEYADQIAVNSQTLQVGDVTATGAGDGAVLGDYAGKGILNGADGFNYRCQDFGQLIVLGFITAKPVYADGYDRQVLKTDCMDFYQGEDFDGVGINAISIDEVTTQPTNDDFNFVTMAGTNVFGYTERYNEYRCAKDKVTGDMCLPRYADAQLWHLNRNLNGILSAGELHAQSTMFMRFEGLEYNKIFSITDSAEDKFYLTCNFDVKAIRPLKSISGASGLGDGSLQVSRNGNIIN